MLQAHSNQFGQVYLDSGDICVLRGVLVVVETILGSLALSQLNTKFDEQEDDRLERGDGAVAGALGGDMLVEELQGGLLLLDSDEFLGAFAAAALAGDGRPARGGHVQSILRLAVRGRRHVGRLWIEYRGSESREGG